MATFKKGLKVNCRRRLIFESDEEGEPKKMTPTPIAVSDMEEEPAERLVIEEPSREVMLNDMMITVDDNLHLLIEGLKDRLNLPTQMFWELMQSAHKIDKAFQAIMDKKVVDVSIHLGGNFRVVLRDPYWVIHISRWMKNAQGLGFKEQGISLKRGEWKALNRFFQRLTIPEFINFRPCYADHDNQMTALTCSTCNPNTYQKW